MAGYAEGAPCWAVAMLPDVAAGKRFYGELLGWSFGEPDPERHTHTTATLDGKAVAGLLAKPDGRMPTDWNIHLCVPDAAAAAGRIREAGGRVIMDPFPLGEAGVTAVAADPGGAVFQLWQPGSMTGFATTGEPGRTPGPRCMSERGTRRRSTASTRRSSASPPRTSPRCWARTS